MTMENEYPLFMKARRAILDAALPIAAFDGWTARTLEAAARDADLPEGAEALYFEGGPVEAIEFWSAECDRAMQAAFEADETDGLRYRDKVAFAVMTRFEAVRGHREAARRAASRLSLPGAGKTGARALWRSADAIWSALGDSSTDINWYSKRAILSGVIASTFPVFLDDKTSDLSETRAFLDRRIGNVMEFEKAKAKARAFTEKLPDPLKVLAQLRYGGPRRA